METRPPPTRDQAAHLPLPGAAARPCSARWPTTCAAAPAWAAGRSRWPPRSASPARSVPRWGAPRTPFLPRRGGRGLPVRATYLALRERERPPAELWASRRCSPTRGRAASPSISATSSCDAAPPPVVLGPGGGHLGLQRPVLLERHGGLSARLGSPEEAGRFFGRTIRSGSHPASVGLVAAAGRTPRASTRTS
jgi:hypothetical protein